MKSAVQYMESTACFSENRRHRYALKRLWGPGKSLVFIGLNPSIADEVSDDNTVSRCVGFAKAWGYGSLTVVNVFSRVMRDSKKIKTCSVINMPENDAHIVLEVKKADLIIAGWGELGSHKNRDLAVLKLLKDVEIYCLAVTKTNRPRHPLFLPKSSKPIKLKGLK